LTTPVGPELPKAPIMIGVPAKNIVGPGNIGVPSKNIKATSALQKYLAGDTTYQQQLAEYNQEENAYRQNQQRQDQITNRDFSTTQRSMNRQADVDRQNQQYDFAGRGILHSGVFAKALGDYNTDFQTKMNNLIQGKNDTLTESQANLNDFLRSLALQKNSAKQDAIRRRQASLGL
jgi:hypothetical protein